MNATNEIDEIKSMIVTNSSIINFGSMENAVDKNWIDRAEAVLNKPLSNSYKWFLTNYAGGEVGGEEIYSIYGMPFENVNGGDIVFQYLINRKGSFFNESQLVVSETDLGECFFFDYSKWINGECPIYLRLPSGKEIFYANNFYEFLRKRILAHS